MVAQSLHVYQSIPFVTSTRKLSYLKGEPFIWLHTRRQHSCLFVRKRLKKEWLSFQIKASQDTDIQASPASSSAAVELGLALFKKDRVRDALAQFDAALNTNPNPEEAQAALYNKACCHACRGEEQLASEALRKALRDYGLKFSVILNDPDLALFRSTEEFKTLQDEARKGGQDVGQGFRRDLKLIGEVQAPFRAVRKFLYVVLSAAAGVSTIINGPRLFFAIQGGENAPDVWEVAKNLGINIAGIVAFVALFIWDARREEEQLARISRDETLSRLPLRLNNNRVVELVQLRDSSRPIILAGNKDAVTRAVQRAERFRTELLKRGVLLVPLIWSITKEEVFGKKKKGFGNQGPPVPASTVAADDFEARAREISSKTVEKADRKLKAEVVSPLEWESWVREQQKVEGVEPGSEVYIVLRLDGRVRKSGKPAACNLREREKESSCYLQPPSATFASQGVLWLKNAGLRGSPAENAESGEIALAEKPDLME
ncbi:hypothetical protein L7F22_041166 [Adiantum nelumboides]|nr:hypothetical protein [Adiantum nelumboides]